MGKMFTRRRFCLLRGIALFALLTILLVTPKRLSTEVAQSSSSTSVIVPTTVKVILIQFNDVRGKDFWNGSGWIDFDNRYKMADFSALLTSLGSYTGDRGTDDEEVFGSFRDYFHENSRETYSPAVQILNSTDANGYPVWIDLPNNKSTYTTSTIIGAANTAATNAGLDISTSTTVKRCYIYAGNWVSAIDVFANALHGHTMVVP